MKFFVVISTLLVATKAGVITPVVLPAIAAAPIVAVPVGLQSSQYHSQDAIGQYSYGYANELSAKNEIKSADGQTVGAYAYLDPNGKIQNVQYRADALNGFKVSASNLPVAPAAPKVAPLIQPEPVKDTAEVVEARAQHLEAFRQIEEEAKKVNEIAAVEVKSAIQAQPAVVAAAAPVPAPAALVRAAPALLTTPAFSYSFGINHGGLFTVNSYALQPQAIVTAYAAPGALIAAPIAAEAAPVKAEPAEQAVSQPSNDLPEVIAARSKELAEAATIKEDGEKEQEKAKE